MSVKEDKPKSEPVGSKPPPSGPPNAVSEPKEPPKRRQCPVCWGGSQGVGVAYCTRKPIRYYKCQKCGYTWPHTTKTPVEFHDIELEERGA